MDFSGKSESSDDSDSDDSSSDEDEANPKKLKVPFRLDLALRGHIVIDYCSSSALTPFICVYYPSTHPFLQAADPDAVEYDDSDAVPALTLPSSIHVALWRDFDAIQSHRKLVGLPKPKEETIHDILTSWKDTQFDAGYGMPLCVVLLLGALRFHVSY